MTTWKDWFISLSTAVLLASSSSYGPESFRFELLPTQIKLGERARLEIRLPVENLSANEEIVPLLRDDLLYNSESIVVLSKDQKREGNDFVWSYYLTSHKTGTITIPPVELEVAGHSYSTESVSLEVSHGRAEGDFQLREDFGVVNPPLPQKWLIWAALVVGLGLSGYFLRKRIALRKKNVPASPSSPVEEESPDLWLAKELERLRKMAQHPTKFREVGDEWPKIMRQYLAKKTRNPTESWTTRELKGQLRRDDRVQSLVPHFEQYDRLRFSGGATEMVQESVLATVSESERLLLPWH